MQVDAASWLSLVTRTSVAAATATVTLTEPDGPHRQLSEHRLAADDLRHWTYEVRGDGEEERRSCDGRELVQTAGGRTVRSAFPAAPAPTDDPWYFSSWPGVVDAWLVEMLRPVDLLARVVVSAVDPAQAGAEVQMRATPMGNEPSPYSGFAQPDGRSLTLLLDARRGCFSEVTVTHAGESGRAHRLTHRLIRFE
ncbi:hypothetical protein GCM10028832_09130 [Streptomyces sparsus]